MCLLLRSHSFSLSLSSLSESDFPIYVFCLHSSLPFILLPDQELSFRPCEPGASENQSLWMDPYHCPHSQGLTFQASQCFIWEQILRSKDSLTFGLFIRVCGALANLKTSFCLPSTAGSNVTFLLQALVSLQGKPSPRASRKWNIPCLVFSSL